MRCNIHDFDKLEEGKELGIAIGEERAKLEDARNLLKENVSEDVISRCTGLPLEKVRELAKELKIES